MTVNGRRLSGLALSVVLHAALFAALALLPPRPGPRALEQHRTLAVVYIGQPLESAAAEILAEEQQIDDASDDPAQLRMPGFELDIARIRARHDALFPFLTEDLPVVDDLRRAASARAASLTWFNSRPPERSPSGLPPLTITDAQLTR